MFCFSTESKKAVTEYVAKKCTPILRLLFFLSNQIGCLNQSRKNREKRNEKETATFCRFGIHASSVRCTRAKKLKIAG